MASCAGSTGIPLARIKIAKRKGCSAFQWNRVVLAELLPFLFADDNDDEANADWAKELKKAQTLRERIKLAEDQRRVLDRGEVQEAIAKNLTLLFGQLDRIFASELPAQAKGRDEIGIRDLAIARIEELKAIVRAGIGQSEAPE